MPQRRPISLRAHVALLCALLVLCLSLLLGSVVWWRSAVMLEEAAGASLRDLSYQMADKLDRDMALRISEVETLAQLIPLPDSVAGDPEQLARLRRAINGFSLAFPFTAWMGALSSDGEVIAATGDMLLGANIAGRPVFQEGVKGLFVGDVHEAVLLAKLLPGNEPYRFVDVAVPLLDATGRVRGVLASHFSWAWAHALETSVIRPAQQRHQMQLFIVANGGDVLLGGDLNQPMRIDLPALADARLNGSGWSIETWPSGDRFLTGYTRTTGIGRFQGLGWTVLARQPLDVARAPAFELLRQILALGLAAALIFSLLGWTLAGYLTAPLVAITDRAEQIRTRRHDIAFPAHYGIAEVRRLSLTLQALVASLTRKDRALAQMTGIAYRDSVTGLPNRLLLEQTLGELEGGRSPFAILYIDLDGFKPVNDQHGHACGDEMLTMVGRRLGGCLRGSDFLARIGGDEFLILVSGASNLRETAATIADQVRAVLAEPFILNGTPVIIGCSIGLTLWPEEGEDIQDCLALADQAMYRAKKRRLGVSHSQSTVAFPKSPPLTGTGD